MKDGSPLNVGVATSGQTVDDPRLDTSSWRVFGRRFPRRWSFYFRVVAAALLVFAMLWWFTRDVTYVENVKVSGLDAVETRYEEPLRSVAGEFAVMVNWLAERGYAWQSGGLPALRAADALSAEEAEAYVALATVQTRGGEGSLAGPTGGKLARVLENRGWTVPDASLDGSSLTVGPVEATISIHDAARGREKLQIEIIDPAS